MNELETSNDAMKRAFLALKTLREKYERLESAHCEPVAIVGLGCRFPGGAVDEESLWRLLSTGENAISEVHPSRWDLSEYFDPDPNAPGKTYTRRGGFLSQVDQFDPDFFGIAPREATSMDPQQRLLLEVAWEALENAGIAPDRLSGSSTGVFLGISTSDYRELELGSGNAADLDAYFGTGNVFSVAAGRLSYLLGLQGPNLALDTACSSSLVATHLAVQALRVRECHLALVGGVNLMLSPMATVYFSKLKALSPDGYCKAFDASADGYGRGEGCGVLVLKRLQDALEARDQVLAVIRGSAINHDGRSNGLTAPNGAAQQKVLQQALANARLQAEDISYVEAHGTGTALGDPIEMQALAAVYGQRVSPLLVGTIKANIGHLEAAAGLAGLIKAVAMLRKRQVPPQIHFKNPNPQIPWQQIPIRVASGGEDWSETALTLRVGVSSFGFSGTNAHIILEEAIQARQPQEAPAPVPCPTEPQPQPRVFPLSARTEQSLDQLIKRHSDFLQRHPEVRLEDLCFTAGTGRAHFGHRFAAVAASTADLAQQLQAAAEHRDAAKTWRGTANSETRPRIAFLFTGQGSQAPGMGRELYDTEPVFRAALDQCHEEFSAYLEHPLLEVIYPKTPAASPLINQTRYSQPALFALEYALAKLWESWGIKADYVMGHSLGEYSAACVAGILPLEAGAELIAHRARLMQALPPNGAMAAVMAPPERVVPIVERWRSSVSVAAFNGPREVVISGSRSGVDAVLATLQAEGIAAFPLNVSHAFHSPLVEPMLDEFARIAAKPVYSRATCGFVSNVTGKLLDPQSVPDAEYWRKHVRNPVAFAAGMETLREAGCTLFVELGPHPVLSNLGRKCCAATQEELQWLPSLTRNSSDLEQMSSSLAALYVAGIQADWKGHANRGRSVPLPAYPFDRKRFWYGGATARRSSTTQPTSQPAFYRLKWQEEPLTNAASNQTPGFWLLLGGSESLRIELGRALEANGNRCLSSNDFGSIEMPDLLEQAGTEFRGLVCLNEPAEVADAADLLASLKGSCSDLLGLLQQCKADAMPQLWIVTQGVWSVEQEPAAGDAQTALWGLGRTIMLERPELRPVLIDLPREISAEAVSPLLTAEFDHIQENEQLALRDSRRFVLRLAQTQLPEVGKVKFSDEATYLITGGLGDLGRPLARWLIEHGARNLLLVGRRPPTEDAAEEIEELRKSAEIIVAEGDVAKFDDVLRIVRRCGTDLPPLKGVFHLAGMLDDGMLLNQTWDRFAPVLAGKAGGGWNLHAATRDLRLDHFVTYSSVTAVLGLPGQSNYAAANASLDGLIQHRRSQDLPAVGINWGPWSKVGMAARRSIPAVGLRPMETAECLQMLEQTLLSDIDQVVVMAANWQEIGQRFGAGHAPALLMNLATSVAAPGGDLSQKLAGLPIAEARRILTREVTDEAMAVLGRDASNPLDPQQGFFVAGMDSLMAMELRNRLQMRLGNRIDLPPTIVFDHPDLQRLVEELAKRAGLADRSISRSEQAPVTEYEGPIAVVGIGCRFPGGGNDPESFWELLRTGADAVGVVPPERWDTEKYYDSNPDAPGKMYVRHGGFLQKIDEFDAGFFGISPREALRIDPQQRLLMEVAWEALEDAGIAADDLAETLTGVYVGISNNDYPRRLERAISAGDAYLGLGNALSAAAGRLSYTFGFSGPSMAVDTACSSSLVAVHLACQDLRSHRAHTALAAGVNLILAPEVNIQLCKARMLAPDGHCKTFDAGADGYVRGEGCGVVVLKRLEDAQAAGDHIWAIIRGSSVNQDGRTGGLTVPNGSAQQEVARQALAAGHCAPASVQFVEAHGTGTALGDPIEVQALAESYAADRQKGKELLLGSVKANIGHLEAAAGIAGMIKTTLSLSHRQFPPQIHYRIPNPHIPWQRLKVRIPTTVTPFSAERIRGAVSSFGFVGTNAHAVLEEPPLQSRSHHANTPTKSLLTISARSRDALRQLVERHVARLATCPAEDWADYCYTSNTGRNHFSQRVAVAAEDPGSAREKLEHWLEQPEGSISTAASPKTEFADIRHAAPETVAEMYRQGAKIDWRAFHQGHDRRKVRLPSYPFQRESYWPDESAADLAPTEQELGGHPVLGRKLRCALQSTVYEAHWQPKHPAFLQDHRIFGTVIVPGACYLSMVLAASKEAQLQWPLELENVAFLQPILLEDAKPRVVQTILESATSTFQIAAETVTGGVAAWTRHAQGKVKSLKSEKAAELLNGRSLEELRSRLAAGAPIADFYSLLNAGELKLGPAFQWIDQLWCQQGEVFARMRLPGPDDVEEMILPPGLIDACFQMLAAAAGKEQLDSTPYVPVGLDRFLLVDRPSGALCAYGSLRPVKDPRSESLTADLQLFDESGFVVAQLTGLHLKRAGRQAMFSSANPGMADWFLDIQWRAAPLPTAAVPQEARWLLITSDSGFTKDWQQHPQFQGSFTASPSELPTTISQTGDSLAGAVFLASGDQEQDCREFLAVIRTLAESPLPAGFRMWLVTRGAQSIDAGPVSPDQATLWGMGRALDLEQPSWRLTCLDLDPEENGAAQLESLEQSLRHPDRENQAVWRKGKRLVARLFRPRLPSMDPLVQLGPDDGFGLATQTRGRLDSLALQPRERQAPGAGEIEIRVEASALNFRDVLNAMDLYPGEAGPLGLETAGTISAIGPGVTEFAVGDQVLAIAPGAFGRFALARAELAAKFPESMTPAQATGIPVAFLTVNYAFDRLAKLQSGERVLIHAASGGVGLAAVQWALAQGAEVFATAGSDEKRALLRSLGVTHVFSSRDTAFANQIRDLTAGHGVDVILNSLSGEILEASVNLLAPLGRFVEIGKINIWTAEQFQQVRPEAGYHVLALDALVAETPQEVGQSLRRLMNRFTTGELQPIRTQSFPMHQAQAAFRLMARARHIGKVVLTLDPSQPASRSLRGDATYLVTGGFGGLGRLIVDWMVNHGARQIVITSRRDPDEETRGWMDRLTARGAELTIVKADLSQSKAVATAVDQCGESLRGIFHLAGVLDDGLLSQMDWEKFGSALGPKAGAAAILDEVTRDRPLDFFIMFSSIASLLGSPGQGNYAAANAYLDGLAHRRHSRGLPALSINWGPWSDRGMASRLGEQGSSRWAAAGIQMLSPEQGLQVLDLIWNLDKPQIGVLAADWNKLARTAGDGLLPPLWDNFIQRVETSGELIRRLANVPVSARGPVIRAYVREQVGRVLGLPSGQAINPTESLRDLGLDSLMAVDLTRSLGTGCERTLPTTLVYQHPDIQSLAEFLVEELSHSDEASTDEPAATATELRADTAEPIAIVGMGFRFPGNVRSEESFWDLLNDGRDGVSEIPADRWDVNSFYDEDRDAPGKMYTREGAFLQDVDRFDAPFFGITPREAVGMDPQQRLLLETTWEALEHAGIAPESLNQSATGLFLGISTQDYVMRRLQSVDPASIDAYFGTGGTSSVAAGRLSYVLGLQGPNLAIDTACSSSLVATHLACQSLRQAECRQAIVGGVNLILSPLSTIYFCKLHVLAADGRCKPFDASADGYGRGEGCGVIVLKRLSDAQADGDRVLAVIRGSAVNHDGHSNGLTAPNGAAQERVLRQALQNARLKPSQIGYVEAHGTGTALGDPVEVQALGKVYRTDRRPDQPLIVGTVKGNFGHLEAAAGLAGLIKSVLLLQHDTIPPQANFRTPSPHIPWDTLPLKIPVRPESWPRNGELRRAGVSSFGFSGTNAHVVLEQAPSKTTSGPAEPAAPLHILTLSARSPAALSDLVSRFAALPDLGIADICHTANVGRSHLTYRLAATGATWEELQKKLTAPDACLRGQLPATGPPPVAFDFPSEEALDPQPILRLSESLPAVRTALAAASVALQPHLNFSVLEKLQADKIGRSLSAHRAELGFVLGYAWSQFWQSWGIRPQYVLGRGVGEVTAACTAGIFSLEDAAALVVARNNGEWQAMAHTLHNAESTSVLLSASGEPTSVPTSPWADSAAVDPAIRIRRHGCNTLLELGRTPAGIDVWQHVLTLLGQMYVAGAKVNWQSVEPGTHSRLSLPTYPFQRERYWPDAPLPVAAPVQSVLAPALEPARTLDSELHSLPESERESRVQRFLAEQIASLAQCSPESLDRQANLTDFGLDSLIVLELLERVKRELQFPLYPREFYARPTIAGLARYLLGEWEQASGLTGSAPVTAAAEIAVRSDREESRNEQTSPERRNPSAVFLLSSPRSGSTLLRVMLAGHPDLFVPPELHLLPFSTMGVRRDMLRGSYLGEGLQRAVMELWKLDAPESRQRIEEWERQNLEISEVYRLLQEAAGHRLLIDKSPSYAMDRNALQRIELLFDDAKYLHLVRHPYAMIESFVRMRMDKLISDESHDSAAVAEALWETGNRNLLKLSARLSGNRYQLLKYEELVRQPEDEMRQLCRFLGVDWNPAVLEPYSDDRMTDGVSPGSRPIGDPNFSSRQSIDPSLADLWKENSPARPLQDSTLRLALSLGYEVPEQPAELQSADQPAEMAEEFRQVREMTHGFCSLGDPKGPVVVCLHGILDHGWVWEEIAQRLSREGCRIIAPHLRGHGSSAHAPAGSGYHLMDLVCDLEALLPEWSSEPVILVGHSLGAAVAGLFAAARPAKVRSLMLVEPILGNRSGSENLTDLLTSHVDSQTAAQSHPLLPDVATAARRLRQAQPHLTDSQSLRWAARLTQPSEQGVRWRWDRRLLSRAGLAFSGLGGMESERLLTLLKQLPMPVTLVRGKDSDALPPEVWEQLLAAVPDAASFVVPAGHQIPAEAAEALAEIISREIQRVPRS